MNSQGVQSVDRGLVNRSVVAVRSALRLMAASRAKYRRARFSLDVRQATLDQAEQSLLRELVEQVAELPGPIIEIGTLIGATTTRMAQWKSPRQRIISVDSYCWNPWKLSPEMHHALAAQVLYSVVQSAQVEQVRMDKDRFFATYEGPAPSLVFLDAIHSYAATKADILWSRRVGASTICGHDYCEEFPGVIQVVEEFGGPAKLRGTLWSL
jgi:hypothetical protein